MSAKYGTHETSYMREARLFNHGERSYGIRRKFYKKCRNREFKESMKRENYE